MVAGDLPVATEALLSGNSDVVRVLAEHILDGIACSSQPCLGRVAGRPGTRGW
jgi:hypothetical protein